MNVSRDDPKADRVTATRVARLSLAHNYLDDAEAYLSAAKQLDGHASHFSPKYFLLCHAIELALKAYILGQGGTEKEAKKIRHDLTAAWSRAVALGFPSSTELETIVRLVAPPHRDYSFRYSNQSWTHMLPSANMFDVTVSGLIQQVSATLPENPAVVRIA
jgi:hypothetical protein